MTFIEATTGDVSPVAYPAPPFTLWPTVAYPAACMSREHGPDGCG